MDVLAHGLWGGAAFGRRSRAQWRWAFFFGAAPDVFAFGPGMIASWFTADHFRWAYWPQNGVVVPGSITFYVYHAYQVTHSLVVWVAVAGIVWLWRREFPRLFAASALHILCDIPLHTTDYFPTPYLWPFPTPFHNGVRWASPWLLLTNYILIGAVYTFLKRREANPE